jgi:hypothetical protein
VEILLRILGTGNTHIVRMFSHRRCCDVWEKLAYRNLFGEPELEYHISKILS